MEDKYLNDITEIKNMMKKSSQFISLSGLAGILAGIYALLGAWLAYSFLSVSTNLYNDSYYLVRSESITDSEILQKLAYIALAVLSASIFTAIVLTYRKSRKKSEDMWTSTSKRVLINFLIPLVTGGCFTLILLKQELYGLIAPVTLIFYGLACINASKYTLRDVRYLGLTIVLIGLIASNFIGYGLQFWALGFGVCHVFYGSLMYFKYDRN